MGDKKFTLVELHLDGAQFGPKRIGEALPILGSDAEVDTDDELADESDEATGANGSGGKPIALLVGIVAVVGLALAFRKLRGGDDELEESGPVDERDVVIN